MSRRPLTIACVVTGLWTALLIVLLGRFESQRAGGPLVRLLVAKRPIDRGHLLTNEDLAVREVPEAHVEGRAVRASEESKVLDLRTWGPLETQQTLLFTDLEIASPERRDLSSLLMPGDRAVYVRAMREDQGSALIRPGNYVDVIVTFSDDVAGLNDSRGAVVLAQKTLVLANGVSTSAAEMTAGREENTRTPVGEQGLTLSLNLEQAELVTLAAEMGQISVALRNPDDPRVSELMPEVPPSSPLEKHQRVAVAGKRSPAAANPVRLTETPVPERRTKASR